MYKFVKSDNGLASFTIVFNGAGLLEGPGTYGYSHLIEHLVAKKLKKYENKFHEYGITYNAATSNNRIFYYINGLDEGVCKFKKTLMDIVCKGTVDLTEEDLAAEKEIVKSECAMNLMSPLNAHLDILFRAKFNIVDPIGLMSDIENATVESVQTFENEEVQVRPSCIIDISSKPITKFGDLIDNNWDINESDEYDDCNIFKFGKSKRVPKDDFCTSYWDDSTSVVAAFKVDYDEMPYMQLAAEILGSGLDSPLYNEIRNKRNLAYAVHCLVYPVAKNFGIFLVATTVTKNKVTDVRHTITQVLGNPKKFIKLGRLKSICKGIQAADKINQIKITDNALSLIDRENTVEELVKKNEANEILLSKTIKAFSKVVKYPGNSISTYNGNKQYK